MGYDRHHISSSMKLTFLIGGKNVPLFCEGHHYILPHNVSFPKQKYTIIENYACICSLKTSLFMVLASTAMHIRLKIFRDLRFQVGTWQFRKIYSVICSEK